MVTRRLELPSPAVLKEFAGPEDIEQAAMFWKSLSDLLDESALLPIDMTDAAHMPSLSPGAQRMRRYRRRREAGQQCITLTLYDYQVWGLVAFGFLDKDHRQNREAVADALRAYLSDAMPPIE
jgi:hypothetical protein